MKISVKDSAEKLQNTWKEQPPKRKKTLVIALVAIVVLSVAVAVLLNVSKGGYRVLYPGMSTTERTEVFNAIQEKGVTPQINQSGELMVPADQYDKLLLELAGKGYPKSTLTYDIFSSKSTMTSTETDRKVALQQQLQDRLQDTLKQIDGVDNAVVTLNIPDSSNYVWQQSNAADSSTASVLLTFRSGTQLSEESVDAIKNLVATATPKLTVDNVEIMDAKTRLGLVGSGDGTSSGSVTSTKTLEYTQMVEKQLEDKVKKLLTPRYGSSGVVAAAKVQLDFDKMMQEQQDIQNPASGSVTHSERNYSVNGQQAAEGVVGEAGGNTNIPQYGATDPGEDGGLTQYGDSYDYDYGYIKTQIEKGAAELKASSISVQVNEEQIEARRTELIDQISKSTGIAPANISLTTINPALLDPVNPVTPQEDGFFSNPINIIILIGAGLILIAVITVVSILLAKRRKKRLAMAVSAAAAGAESRAADLESQLKAYREQLETNAKMKIKPEESVATNEVRSFAKQNPEITAELLRSWLKEDESNGG